MGSTLIFVQHNGVWDESSSYTKFDVVGVSMNRECKYNELMQRVSDRLKINLSENLLLLKYQVKDGYPPIVTEDDESLEFYKELRLVENDYTKLPLCTSVTEKRDEVMNVLPACTRGVSSDQLQRLRRAMLTDTSQGGFSFVDFANDAANSILSDVDRLTELRGKETCKRNDVVRNEVEEGDVRVGQLFKDEYVLRKTMQFCAISQIYNFRIVKSCHKQYYIRCVYDKCKWFLKASNVGKSKIFMVRKMYNTHTCPPEVRMNDQRQASSRVISDCIKTKYCDLKTIYTPADIMRDMKDDFRVDVSYKKAWRVKQIALNEVRGKPDESYNIISRYLEMVTDANPGSFVRVKKSDDMNFQYMFMSLYASIKGWQHCRPIVVVDGTFLKATYGGTLLTASVQDANAHILPIAFAIVDSENDKSYQWFFENLRAAIGSRDGMCIVSDRNASLVKAVAKVYPGVAQCYCMYHLGKNLKRHFKKNTQVVQQTFISAATSYTVPEFDRHMCELNMLDHRVVEYLKGIGFDRWARAHCPYNRFLSMTSNIAESVNAALLSARDLPVTTLLECLRAMQQKWNVRNGDEAKRTFRVLAKKGHDMLEENYELSLRMTICKANDRVYQVSIGQSVFVVDLGKKICTCKRFQMDELPCAHALSVLRGLNEDPVAYCSHYYYKDSMILTYVETVYPVGREGSLSSGSCVEDEVVLPPLVTVRAGRPKRKRITSGEYPNKTRCSRCHLPGHNIKTCTQPPVAA